MLHRVHQWEMSLSGLIAVRNCGKAADASPSFLPSFLPVCGSPGSVLQPRAGAA